MPNRKTENESENRKTESETGEKHKPVSSRQFATFEQQVISQDRWRSGCNQGPARRHRVDRSRDGVSVTSKAKWDGARKAVPTRIDKFKIDGVPARLADVSIEHFDGGACALSGRLQSSLASLRTR